MDRSNAGAFPGGLRRTLTASGVTPVTPKELEGFALVSRARSERVFAFFCSVLAASENTTGTIAAPPRFAVRRAVERLPARVSPPGAAPLDPARSFPKSIAAKASAGLARRIRQGDGAGRSTLLSGEDDVSRSVRAEMEHGHCPSAGPADQSDSRDSQEPAHQVCSSQQLTLEEEQCAVFSQLSSRSPCCAAQLKRPAHSGISPTSRAARAQRFARTRRSDQFPVGIRGPRVRSA